jgi:hypothetical protein
MGLLGLTTYQVGCGSSGTGGDGGTEGGSGTSRTPPKKPADAPTPAADTFTYALDAILLGDTARGGGAPSTTAWKDYGFDIDGKQTTKDSTDVCQRKAGAGSNVQVDGNGGIDNSFGANILPIIQSAGSIPNPSEQISNSIKGGGFTIEFKIKGLTKDPKQTNTGLSAELFAGGAFSEDGGKPTFATTDDWPVRPELLKDGMTIAGGSKVQFPDSYINNGSFVTPQGTVTISLVFSGVALDLEIQKAVIVMDINGDQANNGTIAGVINTDKLVNGLKTVAGRISKSLCGSAFDGIAQQIQQTSDVLSDGTNRSGVPCDAISIGIGFTAKRIANPTKVAGLGTASPDPCAAPVDGGSD